LNDIDVCLNELPWMIQFIQV